MIMAKNPDGTYSQVGFIKDADGNDVEFVKDENGIVLFEKGFPREKSGTLPLQLDGIGKDLKNYTIYGNTLQNGTPTPDNPVEVQAVGDRTGNLFDGMAEQGSLNDVNGSLVESLTRVRTTKIGVSEGMTYTMSSNLMSRNIIAYKNGVFVAQVYNGSASNKTSVTFTVPAGSNQIAIAYKGNQAGNIDITPNDLEWLMLNKGETALPYEPYGYKIPITTESEDGSESITTTVYLDKPLYKNGDYADFVEYSTQTTTRYCGVDDSGVFLLESPETESITLPKIPTLDGATVIDVDTTVKPSKMDIKYKSKT